MRVTNNFPRFPRVEWCYFVYFMFFNGKRTSENLHFELKYLPQACYVYLIAAHSTHCYAGLSKTFEYQFLVKRGEKVTVIIALCF